MQSKGGYGAEISPWDSGAAAAGADGEEVVASAEGEGLLRLRELLSAGFGAGAGAEGGGGGGGGAREAAPAPPPAGAAAGGGRPSKRSSEAMDGVCLIWTLEEVETREKRRANYGPWILIAAAGIKQGPARPRSGYVWAFCGQEFLTYTCLLKKGTFFMRSYG